MKKQMYILWYKLMVLESKRLRRKSNRLAEKLAKCCNKEHLHNQRLSLFEVVFKEASKTI